ncbi:hypothetical protein T05_802 [Trichinella murrelli]|uniref:Uncharacterized protein n=1 Tax=Trichinella murrelli TaxID=144512 RepID=A0A0V0U449_9BILA|nr:hypothetical protein T05_802 [Trichinella murrelli]
MESQLSGKKASVMLYTCHNCGGQLWKRRQSEMVLTARLFRPGEAAQSERLRDQANFLIPEPNQRPMDTPSDQTSTQNDSTSSLTSQKRQVVTYDSERMALSYWMDRLQKLCARATNMEAIREATRALERTIQPFFADELLATAESPSSTKTTQPPANNNKPNTTRSIPKLPTFDGDILQFKAFWDQFNAIVHRREDFEDVTKFVHLRSCLSGAALNAINGVETAAENYLAVVIEGNWKESRHRCIRFPDGTTTTGVPTAKGHTIPMERSTCGKLAEEPASQSFLDFLAEHARRAVDSERST